MKILCLSRAPLDYIGGIPSYCLNLYRFINFDVENFCYDLNGNINKKEVRFYNNIKETIFPSQFMTGTLAFSFEYIFTILKKNKHYKIIHLQHPDPLSAISVILAKLINRKTKIIVSWHAEIYSKYFLAAPLLLLIDTLLFFLSTKLVYFTPYHVDSSLLSKFNFINKKITIIPLCIARPKLKQYSNHNLKRFSLDKKKEIKLISVGRLVEYKGYEYALRAISTLDEKIKYSIIGDGPLKEKLNKLIFDLNLSKRVFLLGEISEEVKNKELYESDIFLFPSINQSEAYGLVQLEAMYFKLPIINTFLKNGVNFLAPRNIAITCKKRDSISLAKAITKLIENKLIYENMSKESGKNLERFNHSKMIESYKKLFKNLDE